MEALRKIESRSTLVYFCVIFFLSVFSKELSRYIMSEQKYTKQNRILLVESSCTKVSCPYEAPQFVGNLSLESP